MRVVFSGGEKGSYRSVLLSNDVRRIAVNLTQLSIPQTKELDLRGKFEDSTSLYLYTSENDEDLGRFDKFVRDHVDEFELIVGMPGYSGDWIGEKYVPIWNDGDLERLAYLCEKVGRVAISDKALTKESIPRIKQLKQRWGAFIVGLTSKTDHIEAIDWDVVIVSSWTSVVRYGETQIWDGHGLRRYPAQQKESARRKNRNAIVRLDIDFDKVMEDDVDEISKLAIRSWLEWEMHRYGSSDTAAYNPMGAYDDDELEVPSTPGCQPDSNYSPESAPGDNRQVGGLSIATTTPEPRNPEERTLLPVLGMEEVMVEGSLDPDDPEYDASSAPHKATGMQYKGGSLRNCDNCYLAPRCPAMRPGTECAYEIPVELKTKDQLMALMRALLEMQSNRVLFNAFAEELEGQGLDPQLSKEMDRLLSMVERFRNISDTRDVMRIEMEARGSAGVLSRIFGSAAGEKARELSEPIKSDKAAALMSGFDADITEAEIVEQD